MFFSNNFTSSESRILLLPLTLLVIASKNSETQKRRKPQVRMPLGFVWVFLVNVKRNNPFYSGRPLKIHPTFSHLEPYLLLQNDTSLVASPWSLAIFLRLKGEQETLHPFQTHTLFKTISPSWPSNANGATIRPIPSTGCWDVWQALAESQSFIQPITWNSCRTSRRIWYKSWERADLGIKSVSQLITVKGKEKMWTLGEHHHWGERTCYCENDQRCRWKTRQPSVSEGPGEGVSNRGNALPPKCCSLSMSVRWDSSTWWLGVTDGLWKAQILIRRVGHEFQRAKNHWEVKRKGMPYWQPSRFWNVCEELPLATSSQTY